MSNVTVSGNTSDSSAGGVGISGMTTVSNFNNVTITDNTADLDGAGGGDGGGILVFTGSPNIRNTIVAGNSDNSPAFPDKEPDCSGTITSQGHNLVQDTTGCTGVTGSGDKTGVDPMLASLADNGGPTQTHALLAGSPALDAGGGCLPTDQRGAPRTGTCDIGAYELVLCQGVPVNRIGTDGNDTLVGTSLADGFLAGGGKDSVKGLGGDDRACLGGGNDTAAGGGGNDRLLGEAGKDRLKGQGGKDRLKGGPGKDVCSGGPGRKDRAACETEKQVP
jgi:Ca2+-binding RTX toxin-like protein